MFLFVLLSLFSLSELAFLLPQKVITNHGDLKMWV